MKQTRREFIKTLAIAGLAAGLPLPMGFPNPEATISQLMPHQRFTEAVIKMWVEEINEELRVNYKWLNQ